MTQYPHIPKSKVKCYRFDCHVHLESADNFQEHLNEAKKFNVTKFLGLTPWHTTTLDMTHHEQQFPDTLYYCFYPPYGIKTNPAKHQEQFFSHIDEFQPKDKLKAVKFWCGSSFFENNPEARIDTVQHHKLYDELSERNLILLIHMTDPDSWYNSIERKQIQLKQLEHILVEHPNLTVVAVHMAGNSERLSQLSQWLQDYKNLFLDTSATKWITRELSKQHSQAKRFFNRYSDRVLYGSDLVNSRHSSEYYFSRYWTHRVLFETNEIVSLPFADPDSPNGKGIIKGLDLSPTVLEKLYYKNTAKLLLE